MEATMGLGWTPHPVIVTVGDNRDYTRVLLNSCYAAVAGQGVLLNVNTWKHV